MRRMSEVIQNDENNQMESESLLIHQDEFVAIKISNLNDPFLVSIGEYDEKEFKKYLKELNNDKNNSKLIMAFWLCLYLEKFELAKQIIDRDKKVKEIFNADFITEKEFLNYVIDLQFFGRKYNSHVFEIAIKNDEEYLAMLITQLDFILTKENLVVIIENEMLNLLKILLSKSHIFYTSQITDQIMIGPMTEVKLTKLTFSYIFSKISEIKSLDVEQKMIEKILSWKIPTRENYLSALLQNEMDELAINNLDLLKDNADINLVIKAIKGNNDYFLRNLLSSGYINNNQLYDEEIFRELLYLSSKGDSLIFALNVISIIKPSNLNIEFSIDLVGNLRLVFLGFKQNKELLKCHNPIFAICLSAEILENISSQFNILSIKCDKLKDELLEFGDIIMGKIDDEAYYKKIMTEMDFIGRNCIDIICQHRFTKLLRDEKSELLFQSLWDGPEGSENVESFSVVSVVHNIMVNTINVFGLSSIYSAIENDYNRRKDVNFLLQNKYRLKASQFYFWYEFFFTWCILLIFQYVNIYYVEKDFLNVNIPITSLAALLNITLIINSAFRFLYNIFSNYPIPWDYWTLFDFLTSIVNLINILIITATVNPVVFGLSKEYVAKYIESYNRSLKYFIAIVVSINWVRTVIFFYCIRGTSSLLVTLVLMIKNTLNFLIIISGYLLIMTTIFYFIFKNIDIEKNSYGNRNFHTFLYSLNYLFDAMVTNFTHPSNFPSDYDILHRVLLVIHVFLSNVLLLNYLVAVLMIVFNFIMMKQVEREFNLRSSVYYFSRRFNGAMEDEYYGNLILIQPPLNFLNLFAIPFLWFKETLKNVQYYIGLVYYFIICSGILVLTFLYLLIISPIVTIKVFFLNFSTNNSYSKKIIQAVVFFFFGYFIILYHIFNDLYVLIIVLSKNYTLYNDNEESNTLNKENVTLEVFKEMRKLLKKIYLKTMANNQEKAESIFIQKKHLLDLVLKNKIDQIIYEKLKKDTNTQFKLDVDLKISTKKSLVSDPKINLLQYFINFKKVKDGEELKVFNQEIYDKIENLVNCFVIRDYRGEYLDLFLFKNIIFNKKVRLFNVEKILMINFPIMTNAMIDLQNKNSYGMIEYFDNLSKNRFRKIKDKIEILEKIALEIPLKKVEIVEEQDDSKDKELDHEKILLSDNMKLKQIK